MVMSQKRVMLFVMTVSLYLCTAFFMPSIARAAGDSWPLFKNDSQRTGFSVSEAPATSHLLWSFEVGKSIKSSPVISNNRVFVSADDCKLYAFDIDTYLYGVLSLVIHGVLPDIVRPRLQAASCSLASLVKGKGSSSALIRQPATCSGDMMRQVA